MIGRFAASKAGHDRETCYVIVGEENDFVYLCDGQKRKLQNPKKKRKKHIQVADHTVLPELLGRLKAGERVWDEEIKYAIKQYLKDI
ncbi:MAG: KOW domain-containing RNA-binding protein [Acetatifactor sp.]|nr:KOW domain-containing RNA-binding protein [Acetatifactor sp.]